jgi:TetR/AcrR family transcriptional repressor of nem operon
VTATQPTITYKTRLLDAALYLIRQKGYTATTVDDICLRAGVTKGSFFHYFRSKEHLAIEAAEYFGNMAEELFENAPYRSREDPLERLLGYLDLRIAILQGDLPEYTCLLGTMVQEVYDTHPAIRSACDRCMAEHSADVAQDVEACMKLYGRDASWTAESLALYIQASIQGSFILAKAKQSPEVAAECIRHLRRYIELLFK